MLCWKLCCIIICTLSFSLAEYFFPEAGAGIAVFIGVHGIAPGGTIRGELMLVLALELDGAKWTVITMTRQLHANYTPIARQLHAVHT